MYVRHELFGTGVYANMDPRRSGHPDVTNLPVAWRTKGVEGCVILEEERRGPSWVWQKAGRTWVFSMCMNEQLSLRFLPRDWCKRETNHQIYTRTHKHVYVCIRGKWMNMVYCPVETEETAFRLPCSTSSQFKTNVQSPKRNFDPSQHRVVPSKGRPV